MEEASDFTDDAGPIIDNKTGNNTRPWNKPNITVKQNTWNNSKNVRKLKLTAMQFWRY